MNPGDIVLIELPQVGGSQLKLRPALVISRLPGVYQTILVCGISTKLQVQIDDWDELIEQGDADFAMSGLHEASIIRLSYLQSIEQSEIVGTIGTLSDQRFSELVQRLVDHISAK